MKPANLVGSIVLAACLAGCPAPAPPVAQPVVTIAGPTPPAGPSSPPPTPDPVLNVAAAPREEGPEAVRDERRYPGRPRAQLVTAIQSLETQFATTPPGSPDRPELMRRMAEAYVELAWAAQGDRGAEKIVKAARGHAIRYYKLLLDGHSTWCHEEYPSDPRRNNGCADETLYHLALENERARDLDAARRAYLELIQRHPQSRYIPAAYLAFGELFMAEAANDPSKYHLAEQAYQEVVKYPPPDNRWFGYAQYRLAQVHVNKGDGPAALASLLKAATWVTAYKGDEVLATAIRRDAVAVYARVGDPARARSFFAKLATGPELEQMLADLEKRRGTP